MKKTILTALVLTICNVSLFATNYQECKKMYDNEQYDLSLKCFKKLKNDTDALKMVGAHYLNGLGVKKDNNTAISYLNKAVKINSKNRTAYYFLGVAYSNLKNYDKSAEMFEESAKQNYSWAQQELGMIYLDNLVSGDNNAKKAIYWHKEASKNNNACSELILYDIYRAGKIVLKDYNKALYYIKKSADNGGCGNQGTYILADIYDKGLLNQMKNPQESVKYYKKSFIDYPEAKCDIVDSYLKINNNSTSAKKQSKIWVKEGYSQSNYKYCKTVWDKYELYKY